MGRTKKVEMPELSETMCGTPCDNRAMTVPLYTSEDVALVSGRIVVLTEAEVDNAVNMVVSTEDNAKFGLLVEDGKRLENTYVVPMMVYASKKRNVEVVLDVRDDTQVLRLTQFGTRMDNIILPKGTHIADLIKTQHEQHRRIENTQCAI